MLGRTHGTLVATKEQHKALQKHNGQSKVSLNRVAREELLCVRAQEFTGTAPGLHWVAKAAVRTPSWREPESCATKPASTVRQRWSPGRGGSGKGPQSAQQISCLVAAEIWFRSPGASRRFLHWVVYYQHARCAMCTGFGTASATWRAQATHEPCSATASPRSP